MAVQPPYVVPSAITTVQVTPSQPLDLNTPAFKHQMSYMISIILDLYQEWIFRLNIASAIQAFKDAYNMK
jgi:hypothetical protein